MATMSPPLAILKLKAPLAIGTLQWGTTWIDDKVINHKGVITEETCQEILAVCRSHHLTLFDTAEGYGGGTSEKRLGRLFSTTKNNKSNDDDDDDSSDAILFMTKFLPSPWRLFHADFERAVRASCQRLQVDCIPIYLLHSPVHWLRDVDYWVEAAAICRKKGLIQAMGLSNCNASQLRQAVAAGKKFGVDIVCNQVHYSLLDYNSAALQEMEKACRELNVKIVGFSPIGQGLLCDGELDAKRWKHNKAAKIMRLDYDDVQGLRAVVSQMAQKYQKTMSQVALNWSIQHDVIPLVGCRSAKQANDSVGCLGWSLSPEDVKALDKVALPASTLDSTYQFERRGSSQDDALIHHCLRSVINSWSLVLFCISAGPSWRRMFFVSLFGVVMVVCRTLDSLGFGSVVPIPKP